VITFWIANYNFIGENNRRSGCSGNLQKASVNGIKGMSMSIFTNGDFSSCAILLLSNFGYNTLSVILEEKCYSIIMIITMTKRQPKVGKINCPASPAILWRICVCLLCYSKAKLPIIRIFVPFL
jgi:hypothetical protein